MNRYEYSIIETSDRITYEKTKIITHVFLCGYVCVERGIQGSESKISWPNHKGNCFSLYHLVLLIFVEKG